METEFGSAPLEVTQKPVTVTFFVGGFSLIDVAGTVLEHAVQYAGQFVGGRREGFGGTETSFEATEVRTEGRLTLVERLCCQTQGSGGSVGRGFGAAAQAFATRDLVARGQPKPRAEVFFCGPATHVESNLTDDRQRGVSFDAMDLGEIDARDAIKVAMRIEGNPAAPALVAAGSQGSLRALVLELLQASLDLAITGDDLALVELDEFDGVDTEKTDALDDSALQGHGPPLPRSSCSAGRVVLPVRSGRAPR